MMMGSYKNSHVFIFAILLKSRKFHAREIHVFLQYISDWFLYIYIYIYIYTNIA